MDPKKRKGRKHNGKPVDFNYEPKGSIVFPNQALSIKEILERFTRNLPVDVNINEGTFVDQNVMDLEKVSRMDFGEKEALARDLRASNEAIKAEAKESARKKSEAERGPKSEEKKPEQGDAGNVKP